MSIKIEDHPEFEYVEIEGIKFDYSFFKTFGINGPSTGSILRITRKYKDSIAVTILSEGPSYDVGEVKATKEAKEKAREQL